MMSADVAPHVALCITGVLKFTPNAAPAMARHIKSRLADPWRADVFAVIEILDTLAESVAMEQFAKVLQLKSLALYCPAAGKICSNPHPGHKSTAPFPCTRTNGGCHLDVKRWCNSRSRCSNQTAVAPKTLKLFQREHCHQKLKATETFELMSNKREHCFAAVRAEEQRRSHRGALWSYDYIAYARPELWYPYPRSLDDFALLRSTPGIWVNGGQCDSVTAFRREPELCDGDRLKAPLRDDSTFAKASCSAASDMAAVVPRRWAPHYFSAGQLVNEMERNASYGCGSSFGVSSGICACAGIVFQECLLSTWLIGHQVPYNGMPWKAVFAFGIDDNGNAIMDGRSGKPGQPLPVLKGKPMPPHCELVEPGAGRAPWTPVPTLKRLGVLTKDRAITWYRGARDGVLDTYIRCNTSSEWW